MHTKEARLELLDPAIDPGAPITDLLAASIDKLAEGPDVVYGQGRGAAGSQLPALHPVGAAAAGPLFQVFLQAKPAERQKLLVELLAFGVYEKVGQRAGAGQIRRRADQARPARA